jgi:long-chain acyl-CoA synthetase
VAHLPDLTRVAEALQQFRPTVFTAVPRLYEKIYTRILEEVPPSRRRLFDWAVAVGIRAFRRRLARRRVGLLLHAQRRLADRLVYRKIREGLGGRIRFAISGAAPLDGSLSEFFLGTGIPILESYGLTESSPVIASNRPARPKPGTVGPPLPGVEVRIASDGEIQARGALVMKGYWRAPELTARTVDADGWLSTGDIGKLDEDGYLSVTDRKKEIIVTAQGKNVAPQPLENALKRMPLISQAVVVGDRRPYLAALIVPDFELLKRLGVKLETGAGSRAEQISHPAVVAAMEEEIRRATARFAHHEQIHRFLLLERELSQEAGELTPTLKLKRRVIQETFAGAIEALYEGHGTPRPRQAREGER